MDFATIVNSMFKVLQNMNDRRLAWKTIDCENKIVTFENGIKYSLVTGERCG